MQQFTVPQFIDIEDKIFGPITSRQFIIMMVGFMLIGVCYKFFDFALFLFSGLMIFGISGIFAFLKINGMPFHFFVLNFTQTMRYPNLRVWNNYNSEYIEEDDSNQKRIFKNKAMGSKPLYNYSRLAELSLIVDTSGMYKGKTGQEKIKLIF